MCLQIIDHRHIRVRQKDESDGHRVVGVVLLVSRLVEENVSRLVWLSGLGVGQTEELFNCVRLNLL